jgi:VWFA-related protein
MTGGRMTARKLIRLLLPSLLFCSFVSTAAPGQSTGITPPTTIKVTSRIVYVDVVVRDSAGRIVRGLTEKDFRLLEDGKAQRLDFFRDHTHDVAEGAAPAAGQGDTNEFSNVDAKGEASNSVNIILFDFFNTAPQDQVYARKEMIRFLEALPPGRQTALFVLGTRLRMVQGFTGSTDLLLAAAKGVKLETSSVETLGEQQEDADAVARFAAAIGDNPSGKSPVGDMFGIQSGQDASRAHDITKTALEQLAAAVSGYPGRKNLYWLADTFPVYGGPALELNDASDAINNSAMSLSDLAEGNKAEASSQIAIYPISLMGLDASGFGPEGAGMTSSKQLFTQRASMHEMLNNMADQTGGRAYFGTNDFARALQSGFEDGSNYYSLAYRPQNEKWDGHYRNISVKMAQHGYSLAYRRGYFAAPDLPPGAEDGRALNAALQPETPEETMLLLRAKVTMPDAEHAAVRVDSVIDPGNVAFSTDARGRRHARLMVSLVALPDSADAKKSAAIPEQTSGVYVVDLDEAAFVKLFSSGMRMHQELQLAPGRYRLRLGVSDAGNDRIGTLDMPAEVVAARAAKD